MKAKLLLASLFLSASRLMAHDQIIEALVRVESGGRATVIGDSGRAYGILQIHRVTVLEANRIARTRYTHADMMDPIKARRVAHIVLGYYSTHIQRTTGRPATAKELAFIWNGGGEAWRRANSPVRDAKQRNLETYWSKVSLNLR